MANSPLAVSLSMTVILLITISSFGAAASFAVTPSFVPAYNLSNDGYKATFPMVANQGSHVYVVWTEGIEGIHFRASADNGTNWTPSLNLPSMAISTGSGVSNYPVIQANGSNVYIAWAQKISSTLQVMFAYSHDNGTSFSAPIQITHSSKNAVTPVLAGYGSQVYVAYAVSSGGSFVNSSADAGVSWTNPGFKFSSVSEPQLAAWGSNAYAIGDAGLAVTNDNGTHWTSTFCPSCNTGLGSEPWISAYGSNVYAAGETKGKASVIYAIYSKNNGSTWSTRVLLSKHQPDAWAPMVTAYGNNVYVAFHTHPGSKSAKEYIITSNNFWLTNTTKQISSGGNDSSFAFNVAAQGNNVFTMWSQQVTTTTWNAKVAYSTNGGLTWPGSPPAINISNNGNNSQISPENDIATGSISSFGTHAFATWQNASSSASYSQIYFTSS